MADKTNKLTYVVQINDKGKVKIDGLTNSFVKADTAVKKLNSELQKTTKDGLNPMIDKTGLAGATLVELGRTISDMPYGIRGIANNLSQLSTLFITLTTTSGGFGKGLDALIKTFQGPLGLIVVFQAVIALFDHLATNTAKATEEINAIAASTAAAGSDLKILKEVVDDNVVSEEELSRAINEANKKYKDLNLSIDENGKLTEDSIIQIDNKIAALERLAKATAIQKEIEDIYTKIVKNQVAEQDKLLEAEENKYADRVRRITSSGEARVRSEEDLTKALKEKQDEIRKRFKEDRDDLDKQLKSLRLMIGEEGLLDEIFFGRNKGKVSRRAKEKLLEFDSELKNFFLDIDKEGVGGVLVKGIERVKRLYEPLFESAKEGLIPLITLGEEYDKTLSRSEESLKNALNLIKEQARDVSKLFKASQESLGYVNTVIMSYHNARMEALARERDYALHSGKLTASQQREAIADIEKRELRAQERKIKSERDLFTIKQSLLIAEEIMKFKFEIAARKRELADKITTITAEGITQIGKAQMSAGTFAAQGGPLGLATFAITIGGLIASIVAARKKANAALSALGAPSAGGGGGGLGVEAPDFNVVGASPESQLAQSVSRQQTQPLRAFVVNKDIKDAEELDRTIDFNRSLG